MADILLPLPETQKFKQMQADALTAQAFAKMLFEPDKDGKLGEVTDVTAVMRIQYNDGSSTRIHTSTEFNTFLADFLKDNAEEIAARVIQKAQEEVAIQHDKAAAEIASEVDLSSYDPNAGAGNIPAPVITSPLLAVGYIDEAFEYYITAAHAHIDPSAPTTYDAKSLPTGLSIDPVTGIITGTVTKAGQYPVTIIAKNVAGKDQRVLQITIAQHSEPYTPPTPSPVIYGPNTATGTEGAAFTFTPTAAHLSLGDGTAWSATGLPTGLTIAPSTGVISGTPAVGSAGNYPAVLKVQNNVGSDTKTLTITISA